MLFALHDGSPVLLVSEMAEHTRNLHASPRCSLLAVEAGPDKPLALGRVTLVGAATRAAGELEAAACEAFLQRHPDARFHADFEDFHFWRMQVTGVRYIGGFGRMSWVDARA